MNELLPYLAIDAVVVAAVGALFVRRASFFHPLSFYLFFHLYSFSLRAWELWGGKWPMYYRMESSAYYSAVRPMEFARGLLVVDAALILFALGTALGSAATVRRMPRPFNDRLLITLLAILLPISLGLMAWSRINPGEGSIVNQYQLFNIMTIWPIGLVALAIGRWGFRWYWSVLAAGYLLIVGTQGYHRFMLLLPIIMLIGIHLARRRHAWPGPALWLPLLAALVLFPSLKDFGRSYQSGGAYAAIQTLATSQRRVDSNFNSRTEQFFDQFAGALTLADAVREPLLGRTYFAVLTLPIPRALWPNKPSLGESALSVAAPGRPFDVEGRITTVIGESYINFRHVGIVLIMPLLGFALTRLYMHAFSVPELDPFKLAYIGLMTTYLQIYRDGLPSLVLFGLMATFPILLYAALNRWFGGAAAAASRTELALSR